MKNKLGLTFIGVVLLAGFIWLVQASPLVKPNDAVSYVFQYTADYGLLVVAVLFLTIPWRDSKLSKPLFVITLILFLPALLYVALIRKGKSALALSTTLVICCLIALTVSVGIHIVAGLIISHYWMLLHLKSPIVSAAFLVYCFLVLTNAAFWLFGHRIYTRIEPLFGGGEEFGDLRNRIVLVNLSLSFILFFIISAASTIGDYEESVKLVLDATKDASGVFTAFYGVLAVLEELKKHRAGKQNRQRI
jgi:hypothetical protein